MKLWSVVISSLGGPDALTYPPDECEDINAFIEDGDVTAMSVRDRLRKEEWCVCRLSPEEYPAARELIRREHYSKSVSSNQVFFHGLKSVATGELMGVALWLPAALGCAKSVGGDDWRSVLSLSRLAISPAAPPNAASFLLGRAVRLIRGTPRWKHLVTFADTRMGHTGAIYKATNWIYDGLTRPYDVWLDKDGKQVSRPRMGGTGGTRLGTRSATVQEMRDMGYTRIGRFPKHRFIVHL